MIDYHKADCLALMDIARCADERPDELFAMSYWKAERDCGTAACLIGTWAIDHPTYSRVKEWWNENSQDAPYFEELANRLGLSNKIAAFLFARHRGGVCRDASKLNKDQAIRRLRKVIYYILHKREILGDYEQARRTGDVGVAQQIKKEMAETTDGWPAFNESNALKEGRGAIDACPY